jgi:hypothetical protein
MNRRQFERLAMLLLSLDGALRVPSTAARWDAAQWAAVQRLLLNARGVQLGNMAEVRAQGHHVKRGARAVAFREEFEPRHHFARLYLLNVQTAPSTRRVPTVARPPAKKRTTTKRRTPRATTRRRTTRRRRVVDLGPRLLPILEDAMQRGSR